MSKRSSRPVARTTGLALGLALAAPALAHAEVPETGVHAGPAAQPEKPWALETEVLWPFIPEVGIFTLKLTRRVTGGRGGFRGEAIVGAYARPHVAHNVVERIDEYAGTLGYRQYVLRGLHAELLTHIGYAHGERNKIDGKDYSDVAWLLEVNAGYRFDLVNRPGIGAYVAPQVGVVRDLYANIGPRNSSSTFVTGKLLVGVSF